MNPIIVNSTPTFQKRFRKLTKRQKKDFSDAIFLFYGDIFHPSLKTHKLKGQWKDFYAFHLNYSDRCIFTFINKHEVLLYDVGPHDIYH